MIIKKMLIPSLLICTLLGLTLRVLAKPAQAKPVSKSTSYGSIDAYIEEQMRLLNLPGVSLAIVEGDQVVHLRGFGRARPGGSAPAPQTPFFIGSLTKSFTALAVMQLVEAGKVDLDAPVQRYLPWFRVADPAASAQMTVRHLLNQTSGLSTACGWAPLSDFDARPDATQRQALQLSTLQLTRPVGAAYEYSNENFNLLGLVIEAASGEAYTDYMQTHIFDPLDMRHTYFSPAAAKQDGLAVGHTYWFWRPMPTRDLPVPYGSAPSGQIISSAEDIAHYLSAYLNQGRYGSAQILSSASIAEMQRGVGNMDTMGVSVGRYGMGWIITGDGPARTVWHTGNVPDFSSFMALLPEQKKGMVLLFNADHFLMEPVQSEFGLGAAALLAGQPPAPPETGISFIRAVPWMMRALLLIPLFQILGLLSTTRQLRRWKQAPQRRPSRARLWGLHILPPLVPNLALAAAAVYLLTSQLFGFLRYYSPDLTWITLLSGGFAGLWACMRTGLILRANRKIG